MFLFMEESEMFCHADNYTPYTPYSGGNCKVIMSSLRTQLLKNFSRNCHSQNILGITTDKNLKSHEYVSIMCNKASKKASWL